MSLLEDLAVPACCREAEDMLQGMPLAAEICSAATHLFHQKQSASLLTHLHLGQQLPGIVANLTWPLGYHECVRVHLLDVVGPID